jgi:outer membrane protein assembly factor BamB
VNGLRLAGTAAMMLLLGAPSTVAAADPAAASAAHPRAAAPVPNGNWTVYHHDNAHTGFDSTQPTASGATAGWTSQVLSGQIYTEPLVYKGLVYVATLQNVVYALNQSDGTVAWSQVLPGPQTSGWGCGNINPTGILGTGVIDAAANRIYFAPFLHQYLSYYLYAFDLTTGAIVMNTAIAPTGFDWTIQQQRGALALSTDRTHVYVPFGGRWGDCGAYHGWIAGVPANGTAVDEIYKTVSTGEGMWAAGGVVVDDSTGNVFGATGNAIPCSGAQESDSIIRVSSTLATPTKFQPADWSSHWCATDTDLGSVAPVLISPSLMFTTGKYGQGFLVNPANLGGTNGQLFPPGSPYAGTDVCVGNHSDASFGSESYANGRLYLTCEGSGIVSLSVNTSAPSFSSCDSSCTATGTWHTSGVGTVGPPIVAGGVVWAVSTSGAGLYGFDASTGAQIYQSASFSANHFSTPSEAGGQIFVGAGTEVRSFNMTLGCSSVTLTAAPAFTATAGSPVTLTGTATGPACTTPQYQFWMRPAAGGWTMLRDYSGTNTFSWTSTTPAGSYYLGVHARDVASTAPFESVASIPYTLTATVCTAVSLSAAPASPQNASTSITVTATGACPNASPQYEFWALWQGAGSWILQRAYSTSPIWTWNSTGAPAGIERFGVWVRDASSAAAYDAVNSITFAVTNQACSAATMSAAPASPQSSGTTITVTATGTCPNASPQYEFWALWAGANGWIMQKAYSTSPTWTWNSTGALPGIERFGVWVKDASAAASTPYDVVNSIVYQVT